MFARFKLHLYLLFFIIVSMNTTDFINGFEAALLSPPKISASMQPQDFLGKPYALPDEPSSGPASSTSFLSGGSLAVRNSWSFDLKGLDCFALLYTTAGCGKLLINQHVLSLSEGSLLLLDCRQRFRIDVAISPWKYRVLFFYSADAPYLLSLLPDTTHPVLNVSAHSEYALLLEKIMLLSSGHDLLSRLRAADLLQHLLTEFVTEFIKDGDYRKIPSYIEKIHDLFEDHYADNYSLDGLEASFHVSKYRICREFGEYYGITPLQYLNRRRIHMAKHLLETTSYRIHEVGSMVGIENTNHFISLFKKFEGCTPLEYRAQKPVP